MLVPSHQRALASVAMFAIHPWLKGGATNWITTRRGRSTGSGASSMISRSSARIVTHSAGLAAATIAFGLVGAGAACSANISASIRVLS
jgi:hypothetical protein